MLASNAGYLTPRYLPSLSLIRQLSTILERYLPLFFMALDFRARPRHASTASYRPVHLIGLGCYCVGQVALISLVFSRGSLISVCAVLKLLSCLAPCRMAALELGNTRLEAPARRRLGVRQRAPARDKVWELRAACACRELAEGQWAPTVVVRASRRWRVSRLAETLPGERHRLVSGVT